MRSLTIASFFLLYTVLAVSSAHSQDQNNSLLSFPSAEGFGASATGGRGGRVIKVTNLNADGPGSLKWACDQEGPRIVVFEVSGVIKPLGRTFGMIRITNPHITIAGQTAPGAGITVAGTLMIQMPSNRGRDKEKRIANAIIRFVRIRPLIKGGGRGSNLRSMDVLYSERVIADHVSGSWQSDDGFHAWYSPNVTFQWCAVEESDINLERGHEPHNFGMLVKVIGGNFSGHHNLLAHHGGRAPACGADFADFRNNVLYNNGYGGIQCRTKDNHKINVIGNYSRYGPGAIIGQRVDFPPLTLARTTLGVSPGNFGITGNYFELWGGYVSPWNHTPSEKIFDLGLGNLTVDIAEEAYELVLAHAGCLPRDAVSKRTIADVKTRTGEWGFHMPDSGLMQGLSPGKAPKDSDNDGIPDAWEKAHKRNPNDPKDNNGTVPAGASPGDRHKGYTWIEYYINDLADTKVAEALTRTRLNPEPIKPWTASATGLPPGAMPHKSLDEIVNAIKEQTLENANDRQKRRGLSNRGWYAVQQLSRMGEKAKTAVPKLSELLSGTDPRQVSFAAWALGAIGPASEPAVPEMIKALEKEQNMSNEGITFCPYGFIAWTLGRIGPKASAAVSALIKAGHTKDARAWGSVVWALGRINPAPKEALPHLLKAVVYHPKDLGNYWPRPEDDFWTRRDANKIRMHAGEALANIGEPAVPGLIKALKTKHAEGRAAAARALGLLGPRAKAALPELIKLINDTSPLVRRASALSLVKIDPKSSNVIEGLSKALSDNELIVCHGAALALKQAGASAEKAVPALEKALANERKEIRRVAALALGSIGKSAIPVLTKAIFSKDPLVRKYAARAIGNIGREAEGKGVDALIKALSDSEAEVRREAVWSLALIVPEAKKAQSALTTVKDKDPDYVVRYAAAAVLEKIK